MEFGVLPSAWITGGPNCLEVPDWQIHEYNADIYILRESGCTHYEKPFLHLIFGRERALLIDTGASDAAAVVIKLVAERDTAGPLVVTDTHAHGDHTAGDKGFDGMANLTLVRQRSRPSCRQLGARTGRSMPGPSTWASAS